MKIYKKWNQNKVAELSDQLSFLFQVKLVNIRNDDITDGNPKLTLGLIWTIILHFQVGSVVWGPGAQFGHGLDRARDCCAFHGHTEPSFSVFVSEWGSGAEQEL